MKTALTIALGVYPAFVGLYAAGLFWDVPKDLVGGFSFSDLVFKSSIVYTTIAAVAFSYVFGASTLYAFILPAETRKAEEVKSQDEAAWNGFTVGQKLKVGAATLGLFALYSWVFMIDPPNVGLNPDGFALALFTGFVLFLPLHHFVKPSNWKAAGLHYLLLWIFIAPLVAGFSDAQPEAGSPRLRIGGEACPIILLGGSNALVRCHDSYSLVQKDKLPKTLRWVPQPTP